VRLLTRLRGRGTSHIRTLMDGRRFVVNCGQCEKINLTGKKLTDKIYYHHTGLAGRDQGHYGREAAQEKPEEVLRTAVRGMLPKIRWEGDAEKAEDIRRRRSSARSPVSSYSGFIIS